MHLKRTHTSQPALPQPTRPPRVSHAAPTALAGTLAALLLAGTAPTRAADDVEVAILAIRATKANNDVSPELKDIAEQLKKQFNYTGFKVERRTVKKSALSAAVSADLIGPYLVEVTPTARGEKDVTLKVELLQKQGEKKSRVLNSTVTVRNGKYQFFGGQNLDGGDVLITAVTGK